jgi:hypothetical protein
VLAARVTQRLRPLGPAASSLVWRTLDARARRLRVTPAGADLAGADLAARALALVQAIDAASRSGQIDDGSARVIADLRLERQSADSWRWSSDALASSTIMVRLAPMPSE